MVWALSGTHRRAVCLNSLLTSTLSGGPYRARTDDIHGVNVALYQLS